MDQMTTPNAVAKSLMTCLAACDHRSEPYDHWMLARVFPDATVDAIAGLPFAPPTGATFDGRRESNNSTRVYFSPENQRNFPVCAEVVAAFKHPAVIAAIERTTGRSLDHGQLRIEYCQDIDGFWLEPHVDISAKLYTMLVYLSGEAELRDAGTDIYLGPPDYKLVGSAPYERNKGLIFIPGKETWHGFTKRPIRGLRKSIIINYVNPDWRSVHELA